MSRDVQTLIRLLGMVAGETQHRYRAEVLGIFGSYVRGEQREASDLDVLVRFAPGATLFDLVGLADFLEETLGVRVDVVPVDALREEIRDRILQEAVSVDRKGSPGVEPSGGTLRLKPRFHNSIEVY